MRIQHNIMALNAYRNYNNNVGGLSKNLEKLSSGYRINRAGDDAAGLAISEKMRAQISGLDAAQKNVKDGISLVKTAEGALQEVQDMMNRMKYLAVQSANGTYDNEVDRDNLQKEVDALKSEINRIADSANFNGQKLLDGSLDTNASGVGATDGTAVTIDPLATTPGDPTTGTILHSTGKNAAKTSFDVALHDVSIDAKDNDTIKLSIGGTDITLTVGTADEVTGGTADLEAGTVDADTLAAALKNKFAAAGGNNGKIGTEAFTVNATGNKLSFVQNTAPAATGNVVNANQAVTLTHTSADTPAAATGTAKTDVAIEGATYTASAVPAWTMTGADGVTGTNITAAFSGTNMTQAKIAEVAQELGAAGDVTLQKLDSGKLGMYVGDTLIAESAEDVAAVTENGSKTYTFTTKGETPFELGTLTITSGAAGSSTDGTEFDAAVDVGTDVSVDKTVDFGDVDAGKLAALAEAKGATSGNVTVSLNADGNKWELKVGDKVLAEATYADNTSKVEFKDGNNDTVLSVKADAALGAVGTATATAVGTLDTGIDFAAKTAAGAKTGTWNIATTNNVQGNVKTDSTLASTAFTLTADMVKDGQSITIGDTTYTFAIGADSKVTGSNVIDLKALTAAEIEAGGETLLDKAGAALTKAAAANTAVFTVGYNAGSNKVTIHEVENQTKYTNGELETMESLGKLFSFGGDAGKDGAVMTLQIGDTADKYNKLDVEISDMHVNALGIGGLDISSITGAQAAVDNITTAINKVSSTRGDLGAIQNRLEHTQNNLSVMAENIQDAESSIRDTDVADEMMKYTKNNILIQSAQAMLAQANAVPQGVLQLLQ